MAEPSWIREAQKLKKLYDESAHQHSFKLLLLGEKGTGKTHILQTARKPVHVDSFDKGGTKVLAEEIRKGNVVVDTRYELEDALKPSAFALWKREFELRMLGKYFDHLGTYCLDSSTYWCQAIMNWLLEGNRPGDGKQKVPSRLGEGPIWNKEYVLEKIVQQTYLEWILNLPCDVVVTGHLRENYEKHTDNEGHETQNFIGYEYFAVGQNKTLIPGKFDEMYITRRIPSLGSKADKFQLLTGWEKWYKASTRIDNGKFDKYEEPDIKKLLTKLGWDVKDKPSLFKVPENEEVL